jgi:hypothetical protein
MKQYLIAGSLFLLAGSAFAVTRSAFPFGGQQATVMIAAQTMDGSQDSDGYNLFKMMNVPIQDSFVGPGKAIFSSNRDFNISCGQRQVGTECSFIFSKSARTKIDFVNKTVDVVINDSEASGLIAKFFVDVQGHMQYSTTDDKLNLAIKNNEIHIHFSETP